MFNNSDSNVAWATSNGEVKKYWGGVRENPTGSGKGKIDQFIKAAARLRRTYDIL